MIRLVDSHTEGEPTRVLVEGIGPLDGETMSQRLAAFQRRYDRLRIAITSEPRASEGTVLAVLTPPISPQCVAGVIFANRASYLGMCGHGTIGVVRTLEHLQRVGSEQEIYLDTPVGVVCARRCGDGCTEVRNVPARAYRLDIEVNVPGTGSVRGDVAFGGNWFFLVDSTQAGIEVREANIAALTDVTMRIRAALREAGITGEGNAEIDHVEIFGPPQLAGADSKNFVLCPDGAYDRSPCGTGTCAKMAVLAARGELKPGATWTQESIIGTCFRGRIEKGAAGGVIPYVRGRAFLTAETALHLEAADPLRYGFTPGNGD